MVKDRDTEERRGATETLKRDKKMQRPKQRHVQNFRDKLQETDKGEKSCENGAPGNEKPSPPQDRPHPYPFIVPKPCNSQPDPELDPGSPGATTTTTK